MGTVIYIVKWQAEQELKEQVRQEVATKFRRSAVEALIDLAVRAGTKREPWRIKMKQAQAVCSYALARDEAE